MAIDWTGVKKDFKEEGSFKKLAKKYGCSPDSIRKKAKKENWGKTEADIHGIKEKTDFKAEDVIDDHRTLWKGVKKRLVKGLENTDAKLGLEELKVAKIAGEVLSNVIKGERLAWGLEPGADNIKVNGADETDDAKEIAGEMERVTVSQRADEAMD